MTSKALKLNEYNPPSALLALTELPRAMFEFGSLPWATPLLMHGPRGDGHPVLVLPGFMASDYSTKTLRRYLESLGYDSYGWELGRNLGPKAIGDDAEHLIARLDDIHAKTGQKVTIIGWSLGGVMARLVTRHRPDAVRQIITLGSPIGGSPKATNAWRAYEILTGHKMKDKKTQDQIRESQQPLPVPSTAIYSKGDGVVAWQICREPDFAQTDNIEVNGSHCGLGVNPAVLYAIADRLAQAEGAWKPFERTGLRSFFFKGAPATH
jgi:pimeloyl-ACP methyl ester carboxylesterase